MSSKPKLSIIIVNFNTRVEVGACLDSIYQAPPAFSFEVVVVDNGSADGSADFVAERFPQVRLIRNTMNEGFARANNRAIRSGVGDFVLLLNPDTEVQPGALETMVSHLQAHPETGAVGCRLVDPKGRLQPSCDRFPSGVGDLLQNLFMDRLVGNFKWSERYTLIGWKHDRVREVDWITGACLMVRREVLDGVGLLDEAFFLYYEDVDLCYRMRQAGWRVTFLPSATVMHHQGKSTRSIADQTILISYRSRYHFLKKHYTITSCKRFRLLHQLGLGARLAMWTVALPFSGPAMAGVLARLRGYWRATKILLEKRVTIDVTTFSQLKTGVENYAQNIAAFVQKVDGASRYLLVDMGVGANPESRGGLFRTAMRAFRNVFNMQVALPLRLLWSRSNLIHSPAYITPLLKVCPTVVTIHDLSFWLFPQRFLRPYWLYLNFFVPLSCRRADLIIADSENTKRDVVKYLKVPEAKVRVIYLGVESRFQVIEDQDALSAFRGRYDLPERFILFVGTLEPRKNIEGVIRAYAEYRAKAPHPLELVIAGKKGWLYESIFTLLLTLQLEPHVHFTGYIADEDMPLLYNAASLLVYPSFYEGFGLPPLEAMACGTPVVVSNVSSLPEVVGDAGLQVDPNSPQDIANAMLTMLSDETARRAFIAKGQERARIFTWEATARNTLAVYDECLSRKMFA